MNQSADGATDEVIARRWWILLVLAGTQLLVQLDTNVVNTALPAIAREFEASSATLQWTVDAYLLAFAGLLLLAGALGDRYGRRRLLAIGMIAFALASVVAAFSTTAEMLIACRAAQGIGGALVVPQTLSLLTAVFPREERARAIGIWTGALGLGMAGGPLVGGGLVDSIGWEAVFWIPAPIAAVAFLGLAIVPESRAPGAPRLDLMGALLATLGMVALVFGIIEGRPRGWGSPEVLGALSTAAVLLGAFVVVERRVEAPILPMRLFRQRDFVGATLGMFFVMLALAGTLFFLSQYFQLVQGKSAFTAGLYLLPTALMMMVMGPLAGRLLSAVGPRAMLFFAPAICGGVALLILSQLEVATDYWVIAVALGVLGFGGGMHLPAATDTTMAAVPVSDAGKASAVNNTARQLGAVLGIAILGTLAASLYATEVRQGLGGSFSPAIVAALADGIGSGVITAQTLEPTEAAQALPVIREAFVHAMNDVLLLGTVFVVASGIGALILVPTRMRARQATSGDPGRPAQLPRVQAEPPLIGRPAARARGVETRGGE